MGLPLALESRGRRGSTAENCHHRMEFNSKDWGEPLRSRRRGVKGGVVPVKFGMVDRGRRGRFVGTGE